MFRIPFTNANYSHPPTHESFAPIPFGGCGGVAPEKHPGRVGGKNKLDKGPLLRWLSLGCAEARLVTLGGALLTLALVTPEQLEQLPSLCLWHHLFGLCPACGTLRALSALCHGDFSRALSYNINVVVTAPALAGLFTLDLIRWKRATGRIETKWKLTHSS